MDNGTEGTRMKDEIQIETTEQPTAEPQVPKLLTVNEVAKILGVSRSTVDRRVREGLITARYVGPFPRFLISDVEAYIQSLPTSRQAA